MSALKKLPLRASLTTLYSVSATAGNGLTAVLVCRAAGAMLIRFTGHRRSDNVTSWLILHLAENKTESGTLRCDFGFKTNKHQMSCPRAELCCWVMICFFRHAVILVS